jgi:hypothetical protein
MITASLAGGRFRLSGLSGAFARPNRLLDLIAKPALKAFDGIDDLFAENGPGWSYSLRAPISQLSLRALPGLLLEIARYFIFAEVVV